MPTRGGNRVGTVTVSFGKTHVFVGSDGGDGPSLLRVPSRTWVRRVVGTRINSRCSGSYPTHLRTVPVVTYSLSSWVGSCGSRSHLEVSRVVKVPEDVVTMFTPENPGFEFRRVVHRVTSSRT